MMFRMFLFANSINELFSIFQVRLMGWRRLGTARFAVCHWTANLTAQSPSCESNAMIEPSPASQTAQMWAWHILANWPFCHMDFAAYWSLYGIKEYAANG